MNLVQVFICGKCKCEIFRPYTHFMECMEIPETLPNDRVCTSEHIEYFRKHGLMG